MKITRCSLYTNMLLQGTYQVVRSTIEKGHYCMKHDFKRDEKNGGLLYINEKLIKEQKAMLMSIIKRIGSNIVGGRSIMNVSMPVQIFEQRSMIQRLARSLGHAPNFFERAALSNNVIEQMKLSAAYILGSFMMGVNLGNNEQANRQTLANYFPLYLAQRNLSTR